uniref:Uncharacterized protein n=1 Tax=Hyaloperonospora arabidopsidis (strain Emoy2) TaxID=559515 RepID=M4C1K3_HYAAE
MHSHFADLLRPRVANARTSYQKNSARTYESLHNLHLRATTAKRRRPPKSPATGPLTLGGKFPIGGRPSCRCVRYGRQRSVQTERGATTQTPRGEGYGNSSCHPPPSTYYSTSAFELLARSPRLTPESHEANLPRT